KSQIRENRAQDAGRDAVAVYGEKTEQPNDYALLMEELQSQNRDCTVKTGGKTNWVLCSAYSHEHMQGIAALSGALSGPDDLVWTVTSDEKLRAFLTRIKQVRARDQSLKYREALADLEQLSGLTASGYYARYADSLRERAERPEKNLNRVLTALEKPDTAVISDAEAAEAIREAFLVEPSLTANEKYRKRYAQIVQALPQKITCTVKLTEPPGKVYISTGYELPIMAQANCDKAQARGNLALRLDSAGPVRFGSSEIRNTIVELADLKGEITVSELSAIKEENKVQFSGVPHFAETFEALQPLGAKPKLEFALTPAEYTLQNVPAFFSADYERLASGVQPSTPWKTLKGKETEATLGMNGQFTMGGSRNGVPYDMVFGHPNGKHSDGIWSSFITISVNENLYRLDKLPGLRRSESADRKTLTVAGDIEAENGTVTMTMRLLENDNYLFALEYQNKSGEAKEVGFRLLVDTWAGNTDGVPFLTPAGPGKDSQLHTREFKFTPAYSTLWETIDAEGDGYVYLRNTLTGPGLVAPDQVAFARWGSAYRSEWDYKISSENSILGDSAALLWWQPQRIAAGNARSVATRFGVFKRTEKTLLDVQDARSGFGYIYLERQNTTATPQDYRVELDSTDADITVPGGKQQQFTLAPKERTVRAIPVSVAGSGKKTVSIKEYQGNAKDPKISTVTFEIPADNGHSANVPVWLNTRPYPVRYVADREDRKLRCVVKAAAGNQVLGQGELKLLKSNTAQKEFIYGADIPVPSNYEGETVVEIFNR
ncbi:MAG TPA: hypothetical protein PKI36_13245, partial [Turneriella sp.]|nr:hypothetical protein [Turneriella sp.]